MSLDPPTYLTSLQGNVRQRPIPWDGAVRSGHLTEEQLAKIRAVDKSRRDVRIQTVESDLDGYRVLFIGEAGKPSVLQMAAKLKDVIQYILVLLSDLLDSTCFPYTLASLRRLPLIIPATIWALAPLPRPVLCRPLTALLLTQPCLHCQKPCSSRTIPISTSCHYLLTRQILKTLFPSSHPPSSSVSWRAPGTSRQPQSRKRCR